MDSWYIFIILLFILAIIETILAARWNKFYFLYGIPIFKKTIEIQNREKASAEIIYLINHMILAFFQGYVDHKRSLYNEPHQQSKDIRLMVGK